MTLKLYLIILVTTYLALFTYLMGCVEFNSEIIQNEFSGQLETNDKEACIFNLDSHVYDLTALSAKNFWSYSEPYLDNTERLFVLSICHPVRNIPSCQNSSSCFFQFSPVIEDSFNETMDKINFTRIGNYSNENPKSMYGDLLFKYQDGNDCLFGTRKLKYTTDLYLKCPLAGEEETNGPILMSSNICMFLFVWVTYAACPVEIISQDSCIIRLSNSPYPLNLHSLYSSKFYNVSGLNSSFEVNICGSINNGKCKNDVIICDISNASVPITLAKKGTGKFYLRNTSLVISHYNELKNITTNIFLYCDRTAYKTRIYFNGNTGNVFNFSLYSISVCSPKPTECVLKDRNLKIIDLRPIRKNQNNYLDGGLYSWGGTYHINICGPLNDAESINCPSGPLGACWVNLTSTQSLNLGYIIAEPKVNEDGSIEILYTGGDKCSSTNPIPLSTSITLFCSVSSIGPVLSNVDNSICRHYFIWYTPFACPIEAVKTETCSITDPLYGHTFDLSPLRGVSSDYLITGADNSSVGRINICGPLVHPCGASNGNEKVVGVNGYFGDSVCFDGPSNAEVSGGKANGILEFNDGTLVMNFSNGSSCNNNSDAQWSSSILFLCSHTPLNESSSRDIEYLPRYMHSLPSSCVHHFIWPTPLACPPYEIRDCSVVHDGFKYDLNPLSDNNNNEEYVPHFGGRKFLLNFCRTIVHSKSSRCPYDSASCLVDWDKNVTINLGKVDSGPYVKDGILKIEYVNGDPCSLNDSSSPGSKGNKKYSTIVEFECGSPEEFSAPILVTEEKCRIIFRYKTPYACPDSLTDPGMKIPKNVSSDCTVQNSKTGFTYDLLPLSRLPPKHVQINSTYSLLLSVCTAVDDAKCPGNAGACLVYKREVDKYEYTSAGHFSKDLEIIKWTPFLIYSNGGLCSNGLKRQTRISFVCGSSGTVPDEGSNIPRERENLKSVPDGPYLVSEDDESCTFYIHWYTDLVCDRKISCIAKSWDHTYDLSYLSLLKGNYIIMDPTDRHHQITHSELSYSGTGKFIVNVCRPLNPTPGIDCPPGSGACYVSSNGTVLSLGHPISEPQVLKGERAHLMYHHGSKCPSNSAFEVVSKFKFVCNSSAHFGQPEFVEKHHECTYEFKWETSLVCNNPPPLNSSDCKLFVPESPDDSIVDLTPLRSNIPYKVPFGDLQFLIGLCDSSACEGGSAVCLSGSKVSYGLLSHSDLEWDHGTVVLSFYGGSECPGSITGSYITKIYFDCDPRSGFGYPVADSIMKDIACVAVFNWKTNLTCPYFRSLSPITLPPFAHTTLPPPVPTEVPVVSTMSAPNSSSASEISGHILPVEPSPGISGVGTFLIVLVATMGVAFITVLLLKSNPGRRCIERARKSTTRSGYVSTFNSDNDSLLTGVDSAYIYRVDEEDTVLKL